jgi:hypothetical protein
MSFWSVFLFWPHRDITGENETCCSIISAGTALPSRLKRSLRCWSSRASYIVAFGYVTASFFFFSKLIRWSHAQVLYLISTYRVLPDPWFAVLNASLVYFSVRKPRFHHPPKNAFYLLLIRWWVVCHEQGLYPTVIFIFVILRKSPTHTITKQHARTTPEHSRGQAILPQPPRFTGFSGSTGK